ncbi:uncharacterized protein PG998_003907, partial [Apiospora kogelbergensis]|uniref:uncharacterized protein n=1 Tax=Apiospora kogelbergensis TaxID=1337665 RepID=UPI003130CDDB
SFGTSGRAGVATGNIPGGAWNCFRILKNRAFHSADFEHAVSLDLSLVQPANEQAGWDDLILPPGHKNIVRAVVETHTAGSRSTTTQKGRVTKVDIVRGKFKHPTHMPSHSTDSSSISVGKGCIILLHGGPGVGKTSTAGYIGYEPTAVERNIDAHFSLAQEWGCVVLLDEADVFLGKRNREDVKRNGLVSVFLRTLEYYQGIQFLTTNRVGAVDDAFRSRLHLTLYYPELGQEPIEIHESKILKYAKRHWEELSWNSRQIRNAFQTAVALAEFEANKADGDAAATATAVSAGGETSKEKPPVQPVMSTKQFRTVANASMAFDDYLFSTHASNDENNNSKRDQICSSGYELSDRSMNRQVRLEQQQQRRHPKRHGTSRRVSSDSSSSSGPSSSSESDDDADSELTLSRDGRDGRDGDENGSGSSSSSENGMKRRKKDEKGKKTQVKEGEILKR